MQFIPNYHFQIFWDKLQFTPNLNTLVKMNSHTDMPRRKHFAPNEIFSGTENKRDDLDINFRFLLQLQRFHEEKKGTKILPKNKPNDKQNQRRQTTRHVTKRKQTASFVVVVNRIRCKRSKSSNLEMLHAVKSCATNRVRQQTQ